MYENNTLVTGEGPNGAFNILLPEDFLSTSHCTLVYYRYNADWPCKSVLYLR